MPRFFTEEYFKEVEATLNQDAKWQADTKNVKSTILMTAADQNSSFLLSVENGVTSVKRSDPATPAEFAFEGAYEVWVRLGKGEIDLQSAVLKGSMRFKGSITKILYYKDRLMRIAEVIKGIPKDY